MMKIVAPRMACSLAEVENPAEMLLSAEEIEGCAITSKTLDLRALPALTLSGCRVSMVQAAQLARQLGVEIEE